MEIPEVSQAEVNMTALARAMCEILASVFCENAVLRILLVDHGVISEEEWEPALRDFAAQKWPSRKNEIEQKVLERAKELRKSMMDKGPVQ